MNSSLQSYSPTCLPLNYDSLATREGCETNTGNDYFGALAFNRVCVVSHKASNYFFNKPDTVNYAVGPNAPGHPATLPHQLVWTAWVASAGIRIGIVGTIVPPSDTIGLPSGLYPSTTTKKLTHCFNNFGLLHMAIEKSDPGFIEIKWYSDDSGTIQSVSFSGKSPALFDLGDVSTSGQSGVVCYYLRSSIPFVLFARFAYDGFANEQVVMPGLNVNVVNLLSVRSVGNIVMLLAKDDIGRDVTMYSPPYYLSEGVSVGHSTSFVSGVCYQGVVQSVSTSIKSKMAISFDSGMMFDATADADIPPVEKTKLTIAFDSGEMDQVS